jgi:CelD/BcsL family acetyltransferase involved in cellulose biosynthesis
MMRLAMTADSMLITPPAATDCRAELLRGERAFAELVPEWERLLGPSAEPMQTPQWSQAAARAFHPGAPLRVLTLRHEGRLTALMPFVEVRRRGLRRLELPGAAALGEPLRPLAADASAAQALCRALLALRLPMTLPRIDDAQFVTALREAARGHALCIVRSGGSSLVVDFDGHPQGPLARCSAARRKALRRNLRQLEAVGAVRFECLEPSPEEVGTALRAAFEVEARSWKGAAGSAVLARADLQAFFSEYGEACARAGKLRVRRLSVGDRLAAVQVGVVQGGRCFDLKIGYDPEFARHSPGLTLSCEALADGARRGLQAHEFLGLAEDWQRAFATRERRFESLILYPWNVAGVATFAFDALAALTRRARRAVTHSCVA